MLSLVIISLRTGRSGGWHNDGDGWIDDGWISNVSKSLSLSLSFIHRI